VISTMGFIAVIVAAFTGEISETFITKIRERAVKNFNFKLTPELFF
jgi:hypothetical protein